MTDLAMPGLSDSMEEGTILAWLVDDGQRLAEGDDLVEIETDKATMTWHADTTGQLEILAPAGTTLPVGALIARVNDGPTGATDKTTSELVVGTLQPRAAVPHPGNGSGGTPAARPIVATPPARRIAAAHSVALDRVAGSGSHGRITRGDVLVAAGLDGTPSRFAAAPAPEAIRLPPPGVWPRDPARGVVTEQEPTRVQQVIARRMIGAKLVVPEFQVEAEVVMDTVIALRAELKRAALADEIVPSLNDFIIKASALALREHRAPTGPTAARALTCTRASTSVWLWPPRTLWSYRPSSTPIPSHWCRSQPTRALAGRVREGTIRPTELVGGTFTVSNLGMYGMSAITAVINAPQAAILGVGALREVLVRADGAIVDRTLMTLRLSCDHRILYGAHAAIFLARIRDLLEQPLRLMLR